MDAGPARFASCPYRAEGKSSVPKYCPFRCTISEASKGVEMDGQHGRPPCFLRNRPPNGANALPRHSTSTLPDAIIYAKRPLAPLGEKAKSAGPGRPPFMDARSFPCESKRGERGIVFSRPIDPENASLTILTGDGRSRMKLPASP